MPHHHPGTATTTATASSLPSSHHATVGSRYRPERKIGEGSFGVIFEGVDIVRNVPVAIKFESRRSEAPQLRDEFRTYKIMANQVGIPHVYYHGQEGLHNILVMDLLGPSLEDLFDSCGRKFSIKTTCLLAKQMLSRIETLHSKHLIYRDIKPDNFLIGRIGYRDQKLVHMVDFGMVKHFRDPRTKQHIPYREKKSISGTARYMSIHTHLGREQSRRDDLEALGHVFLYFLSGGLPWQGMKAVTNKQKYEKIGEKKQSTPISELCLGFPDQISQYMHYVRNLAFEETPKYDQLQGLFDTILKNLGESPDDVYDWMSLESWLSAQPQDIAPLPPPPSKPDSSFFSKYRCRHTLDGSQVGLACKQDSPVDPRDAFASPADGVDKPRLGMPVTGPTGQDPNRYHQTHSDGETEAPAQVPGRGTMKSRRALWKRLFKPLGGKQ